MEKIKEITAYIASCYMEYRILVFAGLYQENGNAAKTWIK